VEIYPVVLLCISICVVIVMWLIQWMSVPSDADLMQLSDTVRGSYILFEREHKLLVCVRRILHLLSFNYFYTKISAMRFLV